MIRNCPLAYAVANSALVVEVTNVLQPVYQLLLFMSIYFLSMQRRPPEQYP